MLNIIFLWLLMVRKDNKKLKLFNHKFYYLFNRIRNCCYLNLLLLFHILINIIDRSLYNIMFKIQ